MLAWSRMFWPITPLWLSRWQVIDHMISSAADCSSLAWYAIPASQSMASGLACVSSGMPLFLLLVGGYPALSQHHKISLHSSSVSWSIARSSRLTSLTVRFTSSSEMGTRYLFSTPSTMFSSWFMLVGCCWMIWCTAVLRAVWGILVVLFMVLFHPCAVVVAVWIVSTVCVSC